MVKGLRLGGLKEALALVAEGKADPEEFKVSYCFGYIRFRVGTLISCSCDSYTVPGSGHLVKNISTCTSWVSYLGKGALYTNFGVTAPEFLIVRPLKNLIPIK